MEDANLNQEILNQLNQIRVDINFIKEKVADDFEEAELTDWAEKELAEARATPESECVSHKEVRKMILGK